MSSIYFFSGPCGCGKSTLADAYAKYLVNCCGKKQVYIIHGDSFQSGFIESDNKPDFFVDGQVSDHIRWEEILKFNWECIVDTAKRALLRGLDVVIDYVIEDELPMMRKLAAECNAHLYYVVLTATEDAIISRITKRGDVDMIERALFLKRKLDDMPENQGYLFDNTDMFPEEEIKSLDIADYRINNI